MDKDGNYVIIWAFPQKFISYTEAEGSGLPEPIETVSLSPDNQKIFFSIPSTGFFVKEVD